MESKKVQIVGRGVIAEHLNSRGVDEPHHGRLESRVNAITGKAYQIVTFVGKRGGPGFLCLDTLHSYGADVKEIFE